jgi:hypothetical protein
VIMGQARANLGWLCLAPERETAASLARRARRTNGSHDPRQTDVSVAALAAFGAASFTIELKDPVPLLRTSSRFRDTAASLARLAVLC